MNHVHFSITNQKIALYRRDGPKKRNEVIMSPLLILSTIAISAALVFYTWGVFGERRSGTLTWKYVTLFWIGLACDTTGTLMMNSMAAQTAGGMGVHGITGVVAIVLMLIHALSEKQLQGTNLEIIQDYFRDMNAEDYDVVTFAEWYNCNTVADYIIVRKLM